MTTTTTPSTNRPSWYTDEDDSAWEKVKAAFQRDWQQTKHDMGSDVPDLDQQVGDTVSQAVGSKPIPPGNVKTPHPEDRTQSEFNLDDEPAYRYGYAASRHYADANEWNDETEATLRREWNDESEWERRREAIRQGWLFGKKEPVGRKAR